ncbi:MAG: hypothetical protein NWE92_08480 [Candidatus Bathyarchaeota archaeon]|nr:hypothetical protein [Candidatus Bathyarchaeota archaeon]
MAFSVFFALFPFSYALTAIATVSVAAIGLWFSRSLLNKQILPKFSPKKHLPLIIVFIVILVVLCFSASLITGYYGSTNDDAAFHTLVTRLIFDNPNALLTRSAEPYGNFVLSYPTGVHVLCAFLSTVLCVSIPKIVLMVSAFLPALIALSMYVMLQCLFERRVLAILGLIITAFFTGAISWLPLSWGGLPLLTSLYVSISGMSLVFLFLLKERRITPLMAGIMGLVFFIASETYPVALLLTFFWFTIIFAIKKLRHACNWTEHDTWSWNKASKSIACFFIPLLFAFPYLCLIFDRYVIANILSPIDSGPASTVYATLVADWINFNWLLDFPKLSSLFSDFSYLLALTPCALLMALFLIFIQIRRKSDLFIQAKEFAMGILIIYAFMLVLLTYLTLTIDLPINLLLSFFDSQRIWQHFFIAGTVLTSAVVFCVLYFVYTPLKRLFFVAGRRLGRFTPRIVACILVVLVVIGAFLLLVPTVDQQLHKYALASSQLNTYSALGADDLALMNWISDNVPTSDVLLTSMGDSGQYVTSITQRITVSRYSNFQNYTDLMTILTADAFDLHAVPLLIQYNISYIYIGAKATMYSLQNPQYRHFNATQFLSTPYFSVAKQVGDAWLFRFNSSAATVAYSDASPLSPFVSSWRYPTFINILPSEGGYTDPPSGIYYDWGVQAIYAYPDEGYRLDHWMLNDERLCGPENPVRVNYWDYNLTAVFVKK